MPSLGSFAAEEAPQPPPLQARPDLKVDRKERLTGSTWVGWTNLCLLALAWNGHYPIKMMELHKKCAPAICIDWNTLTLDYPELARTIYSTDRKYHNTEMYRLSNAKVGGKL